MRSTVGIPVVHGGEDVKSETDNNPEPRVALFQSREIRRTLHNDEWWFVITDIVAALTDAANPSDYWKKMRRRDTGLSLDIQGGGQIDPPLALAFDTAGGVQKLQCWNTQGIFRLIQPIPSPKAEPFKRWLAKDGGAVAGRTRKDIERQTGKPVISKENFKQLTVKKPKKPTGLPSDG